MNRQRQIFQNPGLKATGFDTTWPVCEEPCLCHLKEWVHPKDHGRLLTAALLHLNSQGAYEVEIRRRGENGYRWALSQGWLTERAPFSIVPEFPTIIGDNRLHHGTRRSSQSGEIDQAHSRQLRHLRTTSIARFKSARKGLVRSASAERGTSVSASMLEGRPTSRPIRTTRTCKSGKESLITPI